MRFPLAFRPNLRYSTGGLRFGASCRGGRLHVACDLIAYVGTMHTSSMLHFEMNTGTAHGHLTQINNPPYQRRSYLADPTTFLDQWTIPE